MLTRRRLAASALAFPFVQAMTGVARAAAQPVIAPIRIAKQRIVIDGMVNGQGPYAFVIDTGAIVSGLRNEIVQQLSLPKLRDVRLNGKTFPLYAVQDLQLGGAVRQTASLFGLDGERLGADGLLASGMVTAFDSELDFDLGQWRVYPGGAADRTGFTRLKSAVRDESGGAGTPKIYADVTLGDDEREVMFDTGSPWAMNLDYPTGRKLGLWSDRTPYAPVRIGGIAGMLPGVARLVRAPRLKIGPATYEAPLVVVRPPDTPGNRDIVGLAVLRTLNLSFDHAGKAVWVKRNGLEVPQQPYSLAGFWLEADKGKVEVADVGVGGPAAAAGVRTGDVIDGVTTIRDALNLVSGPPGTRVTLPLRRGGETTTASLTLAAYL